MWLRSSCRFRLHSALLPSSPFRVCPAEGSPVSTRYSGPFAIRCGLCYLPSFFSRNASLCNADRRVCAVSAKSSLAALVISRVSIWLNLIPCSITALRIVSFAQRSFSLSICSLLNLFFLGMVLSVALLADATYSVQGLHLRDCVPLSIFQFLLAIPIPSLALLSFVCPIC